MDRYKIVKNLGDGTYGTVYKAENKETGEIVAIKKMKRKYKNWDECMALREVKSLRKMNHPNLVKLKEVLQVKDELMLVFEYVDLNIYQMYMTYKEKKQQIPEKTIKKILFQIALGLDALHKIGFFHRDLKPENLLINMKTLNVKLCDFGLAREVRCRPPFTEYVSTRWYRAPEILLHSQTYNSPIDIFAVGCIMAELYNLSPLFSGANELDQFYKMVNTLGTPTNWQEGVKLAQKSGMTIPTRVSVPLQQVVPRASPEGIQLLVDMLQYDPAKRPTAIGITKYPYFDEIHRELGDINPAAIGSSSLGTAPSLSSFATQNQSQSYLKQQNSIGQFEVIPLVEKPIYNTQQIQPQQIHGGQQQLMYQQMQQQQQQQQQYQGGIAQKAANPFQSYKDEYLKTQNAKNNIAKRTDQLMQQQQQGGYAYQQLQQQQSQQQQQLNPSGLTNYHFGKRLSNQNMNGVYSSQLVEYPDQNQISLGGTLERPMNLNYLNELNKQTRKQNILLKRNNYPQENYQSSSSSSSDQLLAAYNSPRHGQIGQVDPSYVNSFYNQFNRATNFNQNSMEQQQFQGLKNRQSLPPDNRRSKKRQNIIEGQIEFNYFNFDFINLTGNSNNNNSNIQHSNDQEGQNLNKIFEDKLNWAF